MTLNVTFYYIMYVFPIAVVVGFRKNIIGCEVILFLPLKTTPSISLLYYHHCSPLRIISFMNHAQRIKTQ